MMEQQIKNTRMYWYNYITRECEYIKTPTDFSAYIPQIDAAQSMYAHLVNDMNELPIEAFIGVMEATCAKPNEEPKGEL